MMTPSEVSVQGVRRMERKWVMWGSVRGEVLSRRNRWNIFPMELDMAINWNFDNSVILFIFSPQVKFLVALKPHIKRIMYHWIGMMQKWKNWAKWRNSCCEKRNRKIWSMYLGSGFPLCKRRIFEYAKLKNNNYRNIDWKWETETAKSSKLHSSFEGWKDGQNNTKWSLYLHSFFSINYRQNRSAFSTTTWKGDGRGEMVEFVCSNDNASVQVNIDKFSYNSKNWSLFQKNGNLFGVNPRNIYDYSHLSVFLLFSEGSNLRSVRKM